MDPRIPRLRAGGKARQQVIAELFLEMGPKLQRYFERKGAAPQRAEELVGDVFERILRSCDTYRGDAPLEAWAWSIAPNVMNDEFAAAGKRRGEVALDAMDPEPAQRLLDAARGATADPSIEHCIKRAFAEFSRAQPQCAEALTTLAMEGLDTTALAAVLGRTEGATREFISQCRKKLAVLLEPCLDMLSRLGVEGGHAAG
jgi:RNA polymerase sigma-70 factor (ECF subfamily)